MGTLYTKKGDDGTTGLLGDLRVPKDDPRIDALGTVDEASAALGLARALTKDPLIKAIIKTIQQDLYHLMAELAATPENAERFRQIYRTNVEWLEFQIDTMTTTMDSPEGFILPGGTVASGALSLSRGIVRRAERQVIHLHRLYPIENHEILHYLNRLSSLVYVLELKESLDEGKPSRVDP